MTSQIEINSTTDLSSVSDWVLIDKILYGDAKAIEYFFSIYCSKIFTYLKNKLRYIIIRNDTEDIKITSRAKSGNTNTLVFEPPIEVDVEYRFYIKAEGYNEFNETVTVTRETHEFNLTMAKKR